MRKGTTKGAAGASGGVAGAEAKTREPLVRNVQIYGTAYRWDGAD